MRTALIASVLLACTSSLGAQAPGTSEPNLLELNNGAVIISVSSTYGGTWSPLNLADGSIAYGWCAAQGAAFPHTIVFELPQPYAIDRLAVDNTGDQESGYPGLSSRGVTVSGSTTSATEGFTRLISLEAPRGARREVRLATPATAQWLEFVVDSNWGNAEFTEIMELEARGRPVGPPPKVDVAGIYHTNYGQMKIEQEGNSVAGCYDYKDGGLTGSLSGRVMQLEWRQDKGTRVGTAVMVLSLRGDALNGFWYEHGQMGGEWSGQRGGPSPECAVPRVHAIAAKLESSGKAEVYGIYFDPNLAVPKPESEASLKEILAVLTEHPSLRLLVAGHTDSTNTDAYNLELSRQRAEAVVAWLVTHGVAAPRLTARGFGESQPVADNATAVGRALNRRVELVVQ